MPARSSSTASSEYLNTLGELQGFITSQHFDILLIAGDFNLDFDRSGPFHSHLVDFISDLNLFVFQEFCWVHLCGILGLSSFLD